MSNFPSNYENIRSRMISIVTKHFPEKGRFAWLEEQTGISRTTWNTFWRRESATPSGEMVQAIARLYPRYAFWLASGMTDQEYGHRYPQGSPLAKNYPETRYVEELNKFDEYFEHCKEMQMRQYDNDTKGYSPEEHTEAIETLEYLSWQRRIELNGLQDKSIETIKAMVADRRKKMHEKEMQDRINQHDE
ncbi:hypothetical protein KDM87_03685 [Undibacterium sp. FT147W]|uniref:XRE family transcriptional regulator n=1 Tax=Undibacterium rivi TaxID=2828729 RepID=A0ABS5GYZ3_9BURK|nr:hypothetical protein [Undibacterium rivi]MBR7791684.1 hypothetical protein [Undibacterium rivi]